MASKKDLHLAPNLEELNKHVAVPRSATVDALMQSLPKIFGKAEKVWHEGDEEQAYVLYMKYLQVINLIRDSKDYVKDKKYYDGMIGKKNPMKAMDLSEGMSNSLKIRYMQREEALLAKQKAKKVASSENDPQNKSEGNKASSMSKKKSESGNLERDEYILITPKQLYALITQQSTSFIILDVRPAPDFDISHMNSPKVINVPSDLLQPGVTASKVFNMLPLGTRVQFNRRRTVDKLILMDWFGDEVKEGSPLKNLRDAMYKWDKVDKENAYACVKPYIVKEGFNNFILSYPMEVSEPNEGRKIALSLKSTESKKVKAIPNVSNLQYPMSMLEKQISSELVIESGAVTITKTIPSIPDRNSKPVSNSDITSQSPKHHSPPNIDRSLKAKALLSIAKGPDHEKDKSTLATEVLEAEKDLVEDSVQLDKQELKLEHEWENLRVLKEKSPKETVREELLVDELKLLEEMRKLKKEKESKDRENEELREELHKIKEKLNHKTEIRTAEIDRRVEEEIKRKDAERKALQEEVNMMRKERKLRQAGTGNTPDVDNAAKLINRQESITQVLEQEARIKAMKDPKTVPRYDRNVKPADRQTVIKVEPRFSAPNKGRTSLTGLKNLGNTCYMNSVLQCLSNFSVMAKYFNDNIYKRDLNNNSETRGEVAGEVSNVFQSLWSSQSKYLAPVNMKKVVSKYMESFRGNTQQDAHEFMTKLIDWLSDDLNEVRRRVELPEIEYSRMSEVDAAKMSWEEQKKVEKSFIQETFFGQTRSTCECLSCGHKSYKFEKFLGLTLNLPPGSGKRSLDQCIREFLSEETVDYNCENCNRSKRARLRLEIVRFPLILIVHLKRFYRDYDINVWRKKPNFVDFDFHCDFGRYATACHGKLNPYHRYQLYGVCNHFGSMEGGHYTAYCYSDWTDSWNKFDDQDVTSMNTSDVMTAAAYILFYAAIS